MRPTRETPKPVSLESSGFADDRGGLSRDQLEESDGLVTPVTACFPGEQDEGTTLGSDHRTVIGVLRALGCFRRDVGGVSGESDDPVAIRGNRGDVEDDAVACAVRTRGDVTAGSIRTPCRGGWPHGACERIRREGHRRGRRGRGCRRRCKTYSDICGRRRACYDYRLQIPGITYPYPYPVYIGAS